MLKHHQKAQQSVRAGTLYIVATPIGNLADITLRALAVLAAADWVCAEDTRVSAQLLSAYGIQAKLVSLREHNERQMADKVIAALAEGKTVAQISDAGTPAVCDPGAKLVSQVREAGFPVVPVPGASAVMAVLSAAGVEAPDFYFHGFLPPKSAAAASCLKAGSAKPARCWPLKPRTASPTRWRIWPRCFPSAACCWRAKSAKLSKPF